MLPFRALESSRDPAITQAAYDALQSLRNGAPEAKKKIDDLAHAWVAGALAGVEGADLALKVLRGDDACWAATGTALAARILDAAAQQATGGAGVHAARSGRGDVAPGAPKRPARGR